MKRAMRTLAFFVIVAFISASAFCCDKVLGFSARRQPQQQAASSVCCHRRRAFLSIATTVNALLVNDNNSKAVARAPGSTDVVEAIMQIRDASLDLRKLDNDWSLYSVIDDEGRAGSTDGARRILGGIAPQAGSAAIEVPKKTPLYRIDVAFVTVRKAALEDDSGWTNNLDLDQFEELAERILYEVQKADGNFYSVLFAAKGTRMINDIFIETRKLVKQGISDLDEMLGLLKDAGAPGL